MNAAIFDMDGLLLDTEPLWGISMQKIAAHHQIPIKKEYFRYTTGLRIYEVTAFWKAQFPWPKNLDSRQVADDILDDIIHLSKQKAKVMDGVLETLEFLKTNKIPLGLATSSPQRMIDELIPHFGIIDYFDEITSADTANLGKPHPEVYLNCARELQVPSWHCVAFEDSVNGMISAKAARMKVVLVPDLFKFEDQRFGLADLKLRSLEEFNEDLWNQLIHF